MFKGVPVVIVAAISRKRRAIGVNNHLLWHIPDDLKRFKKLTLGQPIIMGRLTFESIIEILGKPLPGRTNIVLTRKQNYHYPGVTIATSLADALAVAHSLNPTEIHLGGGETVYRKGLPYTDYLYLTLVDDEPEGDTHFPDYRKDFVCLKKHQPRQYDNLSYEWVDLKRKNSALPEEKFAG